MPLRQIIVLGIALVAALGALVLVRNAVKPRPAAAAQVAAIPGARVLVATHDIPLGALIRPGDIEWKVWNVEAVGPNFIDQSKRTNAMEEVAGAVARQSIAKGEPILDSRIVKPGEQGFMAALVRRGYRAVAVPISKESAASGFILPGDFVDIVLTRNMTLPMGGETRQEVRSGVVLQNVRVLAIDQSYRRPDEDKPQAQPGSVALLELTLRDAEALATADELGDLSLALRSVQDVKALTGSAQTGFGLDQGSAARDQIRIHAFGVVQPEQIQSTGGVPRNGGSGE